MRCEDIRPQIERLSDGECSPSEKTRAEAHLAECETCREHFRFLKALPEAARSAPLPEPTDAYWDILPRKIMARIEQEETATDLKGWLSRWFTPANLRWAGAMAAGVVAVVISLEVIDRWQPSDPPLEHSSEPKLAMEQEIDRDSPVPVELGETRGEARTAGAEPLKKSTVADKPQPQSAAAPPKPAVEENVEAKPQETAVPASPPLSRMTSSESEPERPRRSAPTVAPSPGPGRARTAKEEVSILAAREIEEPRAKHMTSLQEATSVDEVAVDSVEVEETGLGAEVDDEARVAFGSLEQRYLRSSKQSLRTTSTGASGTSEPELLAKCRSWRDYLQRYPDSAEALEARYRLARCSIDLYHSRPTEERRLQATEDATAFLAVAPEDERTEEIERSISTLRESKNN